MSKSIAIMCFALCLAAPGAALELNVPADYPSIGAALNAAASGDVIRVACGVYFENDLMMKSGVDLISEDGGAYCTTIDAQGVGRVLRFEYLAETVMVRGFTLKNGQAPVGEMGGGVYCVSSSPYFVNCIITDNRSSGQPGGGVACIDSPIPFFEYCTIRGNTATGLGGIGGGVYLQNSSPQFIDCTIMSNTSGGRGGGIYALSSAFVITYCRFAENTSYDSGGALYLTSNSNTLCTLSTFYGNYAADTGGAIVSRDSSPVFMSCTIVENSSTGYGAGLYTAGGGTITIDSSIIAFSNLSHAVHIAGGTLNVRCSNIYGNAGGDWTGLLAPMEDQDGNFSADPEFCGTGSSGNYFLQGDSPCAPGNNDCGSLVGANTVECGFIATKETSWSSLKSMY